MITPKTHMVESRTVSQTAHAVWGLLLAEGIAMVLFGIVAIALPPIAGLAVAILLGWLLLASGLFGFVTTLLSRRSPGFWWLLLSSFITMIVGGMLFAWPLGGVFSLSLALAGFLILDGLFSIATALDHRRHLTPKWTWLLINGIADLIFAAVIVFWLPQSAAWALGLIVGIDLLIGGATLVAMAADVRSDA
jgi:uncharacterized membrane protein HdeD (DUF308 family)